MDFQNENRLPILLDLLAKKKSDQFVKEGRKIRALDDWIQEMMKEVTEWKIPYGKAAPTQEFDALLLEYVLNKSELVKGSNK